MLERIKGVFKGVTEQKPEELTYWEREIAQSYQILNYQIEVTQHALEEGESDSERLVNNLVNRVNIFQDVVVNRADRNWRLRCGQHIPLLKHPGFFYWSAGKKLQKGEYSIVVNDIGVNYIINIPTLQNINDSWVLDKDMKDMIEDFANSAVAILPRVTSQRLLALKAGEGANR